MRITLKKVQTHFECVCGYNVIDHAQYLIPWRDIWKHGIKRRIDSRTGKSFLLLIAKATECHCNDYLT